MILYSDTVATFPVLRSRHILLWRGHGSEIVISLFSSLGLGSCRFQETAVFSTSAAQSPGPATRTMCATRRLIIANEMTK